MPRRTANKTYADQPIGERQLPSMAVGNRKITAYDPGLALKVCELVADGYTLLDVERLEGMPSRASFLRWVLLTPELATAFKAAREISGYALEDEAIYKGRQIADEPGSGTRVQAFKVAIDQLRWSASRRNPTALGDNKAGSVVVPITINTSLDLGGEGGQPTVQGEIEVPSVYRIDAQVEREIEDVEVVEGTGNQKRVSLPQSIPGSKRTGRPPKRVDPDKRKPRARGQYG